MLIRRIHRSRVEREPGPTRSSFQGSASIWARPISLIRPYACWVHARSQHSPLSPFVSNIALLYNSPCKFGTKILQGRRTAVVLLPHFHCAGPQQRLDPPLRLVTQLIHFLVLLSLHLLISNSSSSAGYVYTYRPPAPEYRQS